MSKEINGKSYTADDVTYRQYKDENDITILMNMIEHELSEPYSIYTYRYFVQNWPQLTYLAYLNNDIVGVVIGKLELHKQTQRMRGYVAMIVVKKEYRGLKIGKKLTNLFIDTCKEQKAEEIVLETEVCNEGALALYQRCGFAKVKRLMNYYLNGNDAFRLKLWLSVDKQEDQEQQNEKQDQEQQNSQ